MGAVGLLRIQMRRISIVALVGRGPGRITLPNPRVLYSEALTEQPWEFRKNAIYYAGQHFDRNTCVVAANGRPSGKRSLLCSLRYSRLSYGSRGDRAREFISEWAVNLFVATEFLFQDRARDSLEPAAMTALAFAVITSSSDSSIFDSALAVRLAVNVTPTPSAARGTRQFPRRFWSRRSDLNR